MGMIQLHKMARTTPAIRKEIREATLPERELARRYNITRETVRTCVFIQRGYRSRPRNATLLTMWNL